MKPEPIHFDLPLCMDVINGWLHGIFARYGNRLWSRGESRPPLFEARPHTGSRCDFDPLFFRFGQWFRAKQLLSEFSRDSGVKIMKTMKLWCFLNGDNKKGHLSM
jgi:hypothetical protein